MRALTFSKRCIKEITRDPLSYILSLGLPICMMLLYYFINRRVGAEMSAGYGYNFYELRYFSPGIAVFSFTFTMINTALLVSKDRSSALLTRLCSSPLRASDFIIGYTLPMIVISIGQAIVCLLSGYALGMKADVLSSLLCIVGCIPGMLLYISMGVLFGSVFTEKSAPGICSFFVTASTLAGGVWFDPVLFGETTSKVLRALPFANTVDFAKSMMLRGDYGEPVKALLISLAYIAVMFVLAAWVFSRRMKTDNN